MALDLAPYTTAKLPSAAIRGNVPWWAPVPAFHPTTVPFSPTTGIPGFCGRAQGDTNSANTNVVITFPAGTAAGDFILVCISSNTGMCPAPTGWAQVASTITNSSSHTMALFWKIYTASDGASVTFGTTDLQFPKAVMRVYCGVIAIDANNSAASSSNASTQVIPALTATQFSNEIYVGFWSSGDVSLNGPGDLVDGTSNPYDGGTTSNWATYDGDKVIVTAGTIPPAETASVADLSTASWTSFAVTLILTDATPALRTPPPVRAGMIPWIAPIASARHTIAPFQAANPIALDQGSMPIPAVQAGMASWTAPIVHARHTIAPFQAANPVPYDQQMAPLAAVQAGMQGWWAPVPALQPTTTPFHGATEKDARPSQLPLQAVQQAWWAPVPALQPTTTPFHGATEADARPSQLPLQAIQQPWQAPIPGAQRSTAVLFSPANPVPYDQPMAPFQAVQAGMAQWIAPVAHARTTTIDWRAANPPEYTTTQLPSAAIQQSLWAPVAALHISATDVNPPPVVTQGEPRISQLPSAAIQQSWWAPVQALQPTTVPFSPANPPEYTTYKLPSAAVQQSWWAPVPALQPTDVLFNPANPVPYDQQMAPFAAVQSGMAGWWAPIPAHQVTNTPFHGATEADARPSQLPLAAIQQPWWAPVPGLHPSIGVLFSPANPPEFTIYKLPSSAVQGSWWSPLWGIHATSAEFKGPPPVIGVDAIVVWRHRAGMQ